MVGWQTSLAARLLGLQVRWAFQLRRHADQELEPSGSGTWELWWDGLEVWPAQSSELGVAMCVVDGPGFCGHLRA